MSEKRKSQANSSNQLDVIFLDIDGVLLPFGPDIDKENKNSSNGLFPESTMMAFGWILQNHPSIKIVLSSTWRSQPRWVAEAEDFICEFCGMDRVLKKGVADKGTDTCSKSLQERKKIHSNFKFYDTTNINNHSERQWEIQEWLQNANNSQFHKIRSWVALDDEELVGGQHNERFRTQFVGHVVKTNSQTGLTLDDAKYAITVLNKQLMLQK